MWFKVSFTLLTFNMHRSLYWNKYVYSQLDESYADEMFKW